MIDSVCRYLNGAAWSGKTFSGSASGGESAESHAERVAYTAAKSAAATAHVATTTFMFEQNAFPCFNCICHFLNESQSGRTFAFACTGNEGFYAAESGFVATADSIAEKQDLKIRGVLYAHHGGLYARKKKITATKQNSTWKITTIRNITIDVATALPQALRNLPAFNVDFG